MKQYSDDDTLMPEYAPFAAVELLPEIPADNPEFLALSMATARLCEARDHEPGRHIERIRHFCRMLALELRKNPAYRDMIDDRFVSDIYFASPFHDIGKIAIPDAVLFKPSRLDPDEFEIMKRHSAIGRDFLREAASRFPESTLLGMAVDIAGYHHEKWDGTGYPNGLAGTGIPLPARIMAVADVYDALRSKRIYKEAYSDEISVEIIRNGRAKHFDPDVTQAFLTIKEELGTITDAMFA